MHNIYIYTFICTYGPRQPFLPSQVGFRTCTCHRNVEAGCWKTWPPWWKKRGVSVLNMLVYYILGKYDMYIRYRDHPCHIFGIRYKYVFIDLDMYLTYHPKIIGKYHWLMIGDTHYFRQTWFFVESFDFETVPFSYQDSGNKRKHGVVWRLLLMDGKTTL